MAYSNTSDSDVTETFTDSELEDEIDTGSVADSDNESDSRDEEQNKEEFFEELRWKEEWFELKTFTFDSSESGISSYIPKNDENRPVDYFRLIFDHTLMQKIVQETNKYNFYTIRHEKLPERYQKAIDATEHEMYTFFALYMLMAHTKKSRIKDYWSTDPLIATPMFADIMSRDRFHLLLRFLHFNDNEYQPSDDKLHKIKPIIIHLRERFRKILVPYQDLCIDESLMLYKGRLSFKQYTPSKRRRFGIKIYFICDVHTGIILDFIIYTGAITDIIKFPDVGIFGSIVMTLMQSYLDKGHNLFLDSWFTSPILFETLHARSTGACGPVRVNRVGLPQFENKISSGQQVYKSTDNMLALKWYDKREVTILSTIHQPQMRFTGKNNPKTKQPIRKPISIIDYNSKSGEIDKVYMQTSFVECIRKSVKWYRKLFFHMLDLLVFNTYLLYKMKAGERPQSVDFHLQLIHEILQTYHTPKPTIGRSVHGCKPTRLTGRHFPTLVPQTTERKNPQRKCFVCANTNRKPRTRTDSRYMCKDCDVGLCVVNCFEEFHTLVNF
ncbi:unnamed protein product [Rotaria sp. Silwood2]|nr:unnamed protein product [Rotaria sp. Silwood2]CAF4483715.1 unnamed protein product [Rotaria sp. Silwood2]